MSGEPTVHIAAISISPSGGLVVTPVREGRGDFSYIYRAANGIGWDADTRSLITPRPEEYTYGDWFEQVCRAVRQEYGQELVLSLHTEWVNIPDDIRSDIARRGRLLDDR